MKTRKIKRLISCVLTAVILLTMLPMTAAAVGETVEVDRITYTVLTDPSGSTPGTAELTSGIKAYGDVEIPSTVEYNSNTYTVTSIGESAFIDNTTLESIVIPNSVTSIGSQAFYNATALKSAVLPNNPSFTAIPAKMFEKCVTLQSITIPDNVTRIGDAAFDSCLELSSVTLPDSLTSIGAKSFLRCFKLTTITFPAGLTSIGDQAFYGCNTLGSVALPEGLTSIGNHAFHSCDFLKIEAFPDSLTSIGAYAFTGCTAVPEKWEIPTHSGSTSASLSLGEGALENTTVHFSGGTMDVSGIENAKGAVISGGSIRLTNAPEGFAPTDADGTPLYQNTVTIQNFSGTKQTLLDVSGLTAVESYGCENMMTDKDGKLYLWLPEDVTLQGCETAYDNGSSAVWQYSDGESFTTKAEASEIIFEPYLEPGTTFPIAVNVLGYPNAVGFIYEGSSVTKDSISLNVGTNGTYYKLMIDSDINTIGVNPLPENYSLVGLYFNETPPTDGNYDIDESSFQVGGENEWTEDGVTYGGPSYQFKMPEAAVSITAIVRLEGEATATNPTVTVNGVEMKSGEFLPSEAPSDSDPADMMPSGGYAWLHDDNGTLTLELNNASFSSGGVALSSNAENPALTIKLTGANALAGAGSVSKAGIMDAYENNSYGGTDITFSGEGSLTATGSDVATDGTLFSAGISGGGDITVESGVTIAATGGSAPANNSYGIRAAGDVSLAGNVTAKGNDFGIMTALFGNINIAGGNITVSGGTKALQPGELTGSVTCSIYPVVAGESELGATEVWSGTGELPDLTAYQYIKAPVVTIQAPIVPVTYAVTVQNSENGTVTASSTTASEGDTVALTVAPADGYELDTLTVGGTDVTAQVSEGAYSFTMPASDVTVTATFKAIETDPPATYPIYIGGIGLNDGEYLEEYGTEAVTTQPEGGYAHYSNGVLTLSDFTLEGNYYSGVVHSGSLTVKLIGDSDLFFGGCSFDLRAQDGSAGALEFVNADTEYGYSTLDVNSTMMVYYDYDNSVNPGSITVGEDVYVYSTGGVHATDLTVEGFLQANDQIVLSGKLTREGYGEIYAYSGTIERSCGADEPVNFDPADYFDLGTGGVAVDEDGTALVPGYYLNSDVGEYRVAFFYEGAEWTQENAVSSVHLLFDPFSIADIYIGGVGLSDGEYLANGATAATTTAPASGGYAHYSNGVLTLSDFSYEGDDLSGVEHLGSLTVKLIGNNKLTLDPSINYDCFCLYEDGSGTPALEFISGDSGGGTLEIRAYELVENDSYDGYLSNVTIGENATVIADVHLDVNQLTINGTLKIYAASIAEQLTVNGTLELHHRIGLEGKLIRGENGIVRAEYDGEEYGVIEWLFEGDAPSDFNTADYLELSGGEAVDKDGNALVLGYYFDEDYYVTFFDAELSQSEWTIENAKKSVTLQSKADAGETDPPVVNPPVVNPPVVDPPVESVTIPISGEENSIEVDASVSGSKATVDEVDLSELDTVIGEEVSVGTVTIDFSGLNQDIDTVEIPSDVVKQIAEAVNDPNNDAESLEVVLSDGTSIEFDAVALGEKAAQAGGLDITISIENSAKATLTAAQQNVVGGNTAYDINVTSGGEHISDMGGMVTVHAPYELKAGEVPHGVVVYYVDDYGNKEACETSYDSVRKRVNWRTDHLSLYMIGYDEKLAASCPKDETCPMYPFEDVSVNAWYHDGVHYAIENGLMQGTSTTKKLFSPGGTTTRAQIVTILWRMEGEPICGQGKSGTFGDVPDYQWYTEAVEWAAAYGIVEGYGDAQQSFAPNEPITREQLAAILWRYAKYKGYDVSVGESTNILSFEDASTVSEYAVPAMQWAYGAGIIQGVASADGVRLDPKGSAIRSQAATIMMRFCEDISP